MIRFVFSFIGALTIVATTPASAFDNCYSTTAGLVQSDLHLSTVAITEHRPNANTSEPEKRHIGNAVFVREHAERLVFMTAHHVVFQACSAIRSNSTVLIEYHADNTDYTSRPFQISADRCDRIVNAGFSKAIDLTFFGVPTSVIDIGSMTTEHPLKEAPIIDTSRTKIAEGHVLGYKPFPERKDRSATIKSTANSLVFVIDAPLIDGLSGAPVFRKVPNDNRYHLTGIVISSPELKHVYETLNDLETEMSDKRVGVIASDLALKVINDQNSLIIRMSVFDFDGWVEAPSKGIALIEKILNREDDISVQDVDTLKLQFEKLTSLEQFELTSHLLRLVNNRDFRLKGKTHVLLSLLTAAEHWCYYNKALRESLIASIGRVSTFNQRESRQIFDMIGKNQQQLASAFLDPDSDESRHVFETANEILSLMFAENDIVSLRPEFIDAISSKEVLSNAVFDFARLNLIANNDDAAFRKFAEIAIEIEPENFIAQWGLADNRIKNKVDVVEARNFLGDVLIGKAFVGQQISPETLAHLHASYGWARGRI